MGSQSGYFSSTGSGNVFIGYNSGYNETQSNKLYLDNSSTSSPLIYGDFNIDQLIFNGSVGIGVTPSESLHLNGSIRGHISGALRINSGSGYVDVGAQNTSWSHFLTDRPRYFFNRGITVDEGFIGSYDEDLSLQTTGVTRLTITNSNGDVGIGTSTPSNLQGWSKVLDVRGGSHSKILATAASANLRSGIYSHETAYGGSTLIGTESNHPVHFIANYDPKMSILTNGNVGIGTLSTSSKFEVAGPATGTGITIRAGGGGDVLLNSGGSLFFDGNYDYGSGNYIRPIAANTQAYFTSGTDENYFRRQSWHW